MIEAGESVTHKIKHEWRRAFVYESGEPIPRLEDLKKELLTWPIHERQLVYLAFSYIRGVLPKDKRVNWAVNFLKTVPISLNRDMGLSKVGSGCVNTVFAIPSDTECPQFVFGIKNSSFSTPEEALQYAQEQKQERSDLANMFECVSAFVPQEDYFIGDSPGGGYNTYFGKRFYNGPIRDFFDLGQDNIMRICEANESFRTNLVAVSSVVADNREELAVRELDILGVNNLAVIGEFGEESLVLLDPHFRNPEAVSEQQWIRDRLEYLVSFGTE